MDDVIAALRGAGVDLEALRTALAGLGRAEYAEVQPGRWYREAGNERWYTLRSDDGQRMVEAHVYGPSVALHLYAPDGSGMAPSDAPPLHGWRGRCVDERPEFVNAPEETIWHALAVLAAQEGKPTQ